MRVRGVFAGLVATTIVWAAVPSDAATATVSMRDEGSPNFFYYSQRRLVVVVGDTVRWRSDSSADHTVTAYKKGGQREFDSSKDTPDTGPCDRGPLSTANDCMKPGDTFEFTFSRPGVFNYFCKAHNATAAETVKPDPSKSAQAQPCGMCAQIEVRVAQTKRPGSTGTSSGSSGGGTGATQKPKPSESARATKSATPSTTPTIDESGIAAPGGEETENGGGGKTALALLAIVMLSGAGYGIWRKFLVTR